jgi:osmotically-inducible protein OsmY
MDDPTFSTLGITVSVLDGKATLIGTVKSEALKAQFEKMVMNVKGVKQVDNQIIVGA